MQNWAVMESEYRQVQEECQDLQALLEQRDDQLCTLNQDLLDLTLRMKVCPTAPAPLSCHCCCCICCSTCRRLRCAAAAVAAYKKSLFLYNGAVQTLRNSYGRKQMQEIIFFEILAATYVKLTSQGTLHHAELQAQHCKHI